jgi:hypothetical protein
MMVVVVLMLSGFLSSVPSCLADDHKDRVEKHDHGCKSGSSGVFIGGKNNEGNETTGEIAAWGLAAVNLTVALSLAIKGIRRFAPLTPAVKNALGRFNSHQKKHLMQFHYLLNPLILGVAITHWALSRCRTTSLPEWGLLLMCGIALLGLLIKLKLCPGTLLQRAYKIHTQPAVFIGVIALLVMGHIIVD